MAAASIATGEVRKLYPTSLSSQPNNVFFIAEKLPSAARTVPAAALITSGAYFRALDATST